MRSIFNARGPYMGVDEATRRSLGQLDIDHPQVQRVAAACRALKLKPELPIYKPDVCAHIGLSKQKIAFCMRKAMETPFVALQRERWTKHGWEVLAVTHRQLEMLTDEQLMEHLAEALRQLGKIK